MKNTIKGLSHLVAGIFFCSFAAIANAETNFAAVWAGEDAGDRLTWSVYAGEHGGQFHIERGATDVGSCRGIFLRPPVQQNPQSIKLSQFLEPYCPDGFEAELEIDGTDAKISISQGGTTRYFRGKQIFPIEIPKNIIAPDGVDVLGVSFGMTKAEVREALVTRHKFEKIDIASPEMPQGVAARTVLSFEWASGLSVTFQPSQLFDNPDISIAIDNRQESEPLFEAEEFVLDPDDHSQGEVSVFYVDGTVAAVRRSLRVNQDAFAISHDAMNDKYGSFPLKQFIKPEHFFRRGLNTDRAYGFTEFGLGAGWGAASYSISGEKLAPEVVEKFKNDVSTDRDCAVGMEYGSTKLAHKSGMKFSLNHTCSAVSYYLLNHHGFAEIGISQPYRFISSQWNAALDVLSDSVTDKIKLLKLDRTGQAVSPEL